MESAGHGRVPPTLPCPRCSHNALSITWQPPCGVRVAAAAGGQAGDARTRTPGSRAYEARRRHRRRLRLARKLRVAAEDPESSAFPPPRPPLSHSHSLTHSHSHSHSLTHSLTQSHSLNFAHPPCDTLTRIADTLTREILLTRRRRLVETRVNTIHNKLQAAPYGLSGFGISACDTAIHGRLRACSGLAARPTVSG